MSKQRVLPSWMQGAGKSLQEDDTKKRHERLQEGLNQCYPEIIFDGLIVYSYNESDCSFLCMEIDGMVPEDGAVFGFDMEWPVTYTKGQEPKTALIQICTSHKQCYLFQISCMNGLPSGISNLLENPLIKWTGVGIENDFWKLGRDFDINTHSLIKSSIIDLTSMANQTLSMKENWSLENLSKYVLKRRLDKTDSIRRSNWAQNPLSDDQKCYASTDAYVSLLLYEELQKRHVDK